jgi:hypothetical protein
MKKHYLAVLLLCALPVLSYAWEDLPPQLNLDHYHYADPPAIARSGPQFDGDLLGPRSSPFSEGQTHHDHYRATPEEGWYEVWSGGRRVYCDRTFGCRPQY